MLKPITILNLLSLGVFVVLFSTPSHAANRFLDAVKSSPPVPAAILPAAIAPAPHSVPGPRTAPAPHTPPPVTTPAPHTAPAPQSPSLAPAVVQWVTNGPYGGEVLSLVGSDKGILYAGTRQGVFVTRDWGATWAPRNAGIEGLSVQGLVLDKDGNAYAATGTGLFRKPSDSFTWTQVGPVDFYLCVAVDKTGAISAGTYRTGLAQSQDQGKTWTSHPLGERAPGIYRLAIDNSGAMYAGTQQGLYVSRDNGLSWEKHTFPTGPTNITSLIVGPTPAGPDRTEGQFAAYAGTHDGQVFMSLDSGTTWTQLTEIALPGSVTGLAALPDGTIFAAAEKWLWSRGANQAWRRQGTGYNGGPINSLLSIQDRVFAAAASGVFSHSEQQWTAQNTGIWAHTIRALAAGPDDLVMAATREGIFRSMDGGATWSYSGEPEAQIDTLVVGPRGVIYAGSLTTGSPSGVLRSQDKGASWQVASEGLPKDANINDLAVDEEGDIYAATQSGLFKSADGADHWQEADQDMGQEALRSIALLPDGTLYTCSRNGIFRSTDHAAHWQAVNTGLKVPHVEFLGASPDGALYASSGPNIYRSLNKGDSWEWRSAAPQQSDGPMRFAATANHVVYAADLQTGIWVSPDGGAHWRSVSSGLYTPRVLALALSPSGHLFAGTNGSSVWQFSITPTPAAATVPGAKT